MKEEPFNSSSRNCPQKRRHFCTFYLSEWPVCCAVLCEVLFIHFMDFQRCQQMKKRLTLNLTKGMILVTESLQQFSYKKVRMPRNKLTEVVTFWKFLSEDVWAGTCTVKLRCCRDGGLVVSELAFYYDDLSSNPNEVSSCFLLPPLLFQVSLLN